MFVSPIDQYHDVLAQGDIAPASAEILDRLLRKDGLFFGDRPLCSVLRPRLLTVGEHRHIARASEHVGAALEAIRLAAMHDAELREKFGLTAWEEQIIHADPGFPVASPVSRLDAFFAHGENGLKFTEYNAESPAGAAYNDALSRVMMAMPVMHAFSRTHSVFPLPSGSSTIHALLEAYHTFRGVRAAPRICILDWADVPTRSEFVLFEREMTALGLDVFIGDPRNAEYRDGVLFVDGRPVDLIYKRVLIDELVTREGMESPVIRAVRDRAVCMVNPFRCKLLHKKASLAVVSDEQNQHLLTPAQQVAVALHVPWTRLVEDRQTTYAGDAVDLLPFLASRRDTMVLKPNDEYGGKGIVLGWTVSDSEWSAAVQSALSEPFIVQERVEIPSEPWPIWQNDQLSLYDAMLDTAPFMVNGTVMSGCLTRIATDQLLNVTAGGGSNVPTFLVEER